MKVSSLAAERSGSRSRAGKGALVPVLLSLAAAAGYFIWQQMYGGAAPVVADMSDLDPEVADLLRDLVADVEGDTANGQKHGSLALAYEANSLWPEAALGFANAARLQPGEPLWPYHQARAMINAGDQEGGYALLSQVAPQVLNEPAVQLYYAHQLLDAGEFDEAQTALNHVVRVAPQAAEGHAGLGELLLAREDYSGALSVLRKALELDPGLAYAHYSLGLAYRGLGRLDEAEKELTLGLGAKRRGLGSRFAAEASEYGVSYVGVVNRSSDLIEAGQFQAAIDSLEKLRKTRPDDSNLFNNLGTAYMMLKDYDQALEHLHRADELQPNFFGAHLNMAACYRDTGKLDKALHHAERAVELGGDVANTHLELVRVLARLGRFDDAVGSAREAVRLDPEDATKHAALGELYATLRRPKEAGESFQKALDISPAFLAPRFNLIRILIGFGDMARAESVLRAGEEIAPDNPRMQDCRRLFENAKRKRAAATGSNG